jgi:hypothetical protein
MPVALDSVDVRLWSTGEGRMAAKLRGRASGFTARKDDHGKHAALWALVDTVRIAQTIAVVIATAVG